MLVCLFCLRMARKRWKRYKNCFTLCPRRSCWRLNGWWFSSATRHQRRFSGLRGFIFCRTIRFRSRITQAPHCLYSPSLYTQEYWSDVVCWLTVSLGSMAKNWVAGFVWQCSDKFQSLQRFLWLEMGWRWASVSAATNKWSIWFYYYQYKCEWICFGVVSKRFLVVEMMQVRSNFWYCVS